MAKPNPPLMLQDTFCTMLAEGALELLYERTPKLKEALGELTGDPYQELVCALADGFMADYKVALKPDPDAPEHAEKITSIG